jgi:nicotinate-nucleotide--dimethylbenzimidazole phosphoribosyltransferase
MSQWYEQPVRELSLPHRQRAYERQQQLTKPPGSLGVLETCAIQLAALQYRDTPALNNIAIAIFAADHGVADEGVSAFPQVVTGEMVKNFSAGGAAITVLARELNAHFQVINVGTKNSLPMLPHVVDRRIAGGTDNFCKGPAMNAEQCLLALQIGADVIDGLGSIDLFIGGEMGIANTTTAAALACAALKLLPEDMVGRGTGVDDKGMALKARVVSAALRLHEQKLVSPLSALQHLGGFEIAALAGAYIRCAQIGIPVLVDGFICTAAALMAVQLNESIRPWLMFSHCSAERGHRLLIEHLDARPLLNLDMRLGEGSGAAVAVPLLRAACALHNQMASFASAGVSRE